MPSAVGASTRLGRGAARRAGKQCEEHLKRASGGAAAAFDPKVVGGLTRKAEEIGVRY